MNQPTLLAIDTLDDRREIWHLLHRLPPRDRVRLLFRFCKSAEKPGRPCVVPEPEWWNEARDAERDDRLDDKLTTEIFLTLAGLASQYDLDLAKFACELEQIVKRRAN